MSITHNRRFSGVWIPAEIWLENGLNALEKILLVEINSLDNENGCTAGNDYFSGFLGVTTIRVSQMIKRLKDDEYIYEESFDGRVRTLKSNIKTIVKQSKDDYKAGLKETIKQNKINYKADLKETINNNNRYNNQSSNSFNKDIKKETDSLKSLQQIETFFQNKCSDSTDENLEIINNDFSKEEISLLAEFAINRTKDKKNIKNTKTALKASVYNKALKIKASLGDSGIGFSEIFRKDEDVYVYLMKDGGSRVVDSLGDWIVGSVLRDRQDRQIKINSSKAPPKQYIYQGYTDQEREEMMETQRKIRDKLQKTQDGDFND